MTGWDILSDIIKNFPPIAVGLFILIAGIFFSIGFFRYGVNFIKYGFKQSDIANLVDKLATKEDINRLDVKIEAMDSRIGGLDVKIEAMDSRIGGLETKIEAIETNHFGHLKNFLTELTSILLDKNIINNQDKARLDNELRGM